MNIIELLFGEKRKSKSKSEEFEITEDIEQIKLFIDNIASSALANTSDSRRGVNIYKYSDSIFTVVKTVYFYTNGTMRISRSIILDDGFEVFNGNVAVKTKKWLKHLSDVNEKSLKNENKRLTLKHR